MTEEFESVANHVLECAHRVLNRKKELLGKLPDVLFVQADNCTRENKNRYFMAYFEMLVAKGVFLEVQVLFLPIGHTHSDIDQSFSSVANRLRIVNTITMGDFHDELGQCYNPRAIASEVLKVANFSGLCESLKCLNKVETFSKFRYFRFTRVTEDNTEAPCPTVCDVKIQDADEWQSLPARGAIKGFLKFVPDLHETPPRVSSPPDIVIEIKKCLRSVEERIRNSNKQKVLEDLRDKIYKKRTDEFHWDLESCFEMNSDYCSAEPEQGEVDEEESDQESPIDKLRYDPNWLVAVRPDSIQTSCEFWIARILRVSKTDREGRAIKISVICYIAVPGSTDEYQARYKQSNEFLDGERVPHRQVIDTATFSRGVRMI